MQTNFNSLESERYILGSFMNDNESILKYIDKLSNEYFYNSYNKVIYDTMCNLYKKKMNFDEMVLAQILKDSVPMTHIAEIGEAFLDNSTMSSHYKIIKDNYKSRSLSKYLNKISNELEPNKIDNIILELNNILNDLNTTETSSSYESMQDIQFDVFEAIQKSYELGNGKGYIDGIKTNFKSLDKATNGLKKKQYYVIGARPSMGKSAFSLALCNNISDENKILYIQLDMTKESMCRRMIASKTLIANRKLTRGELDDKDWERLAYNSNTKNNLYVYDKPNTTVLDIKRVARKLKLQSGIDILIIDHIGKIKAHTKGTKYEQVSDISTELKEIAKEFNIVLIVLCQLNREVEKETENRPRLSHLRGSGTIEEDADFIGLLYREGYYKDRKGGEDVVEARKYDELELLIQKNRDGITAPIIFDYDLEHQRISEQE